MSELEFEETTSSRQQPSGDGGKLTTWLKNKGLSESGARKVQYAIIIITLGLAIYFFAQV